MAGGGFAGAMQFMGGLVTAQAQLDAGTAVNNYYQAKVIQSNQDATSIIQWSQYNETQQRLEDKLSRSKLKVGYIKSGISTSDGTAALVLEEQEIQDEMAALSIRARGITEASRLKAQAGGFRIAGRNALDAARSAAMASALGGTAQGATTMERTS